MKERPILMSAPNIKPLLEGRKTQTRRIIKPQPRVTEQRLRELGGWVQGMTLSEQVNAAWQSGFVDVKCPHGQPGDRLWVRETWADTNGESGPMISYRAGGDRFLIDESFPVQYEKYPGCTFTMWCGDLRRGEPGHAWKSPLFMPRWASRILLEITDVRVERLQDISEGDAIAEGWEPLASRNPGNGGPFDWYRSLWESINGAGSWDANPFVWVIIFKRIEG